MRILKHLSNFPKVTELSKCPDWELKPSILAPESYWNYCQTLTLLLVTDKTQANLNESRKFLFSFVFGFVLFCSFCFCFVFKSRRFKHSHMILLTVALLSPSYTAQLHWGVDCREVKTRSHFSKLNKCTNTSVVWLLIFYIYGLFLWSFYRCIVSAFTVSPSDTYY